MANHHEILIIGGGTAGITVAARLLDSPDPPDIGIVEPSATHYYQPLWTLVGGGVFDKEESTRDQAECIPDGATWIRDHAEQLDPDSNAVVTRSGARYTYDILVVAPGIQLDWHEVDGLPAALGKDGVCSNYSYATVDATWRFLRDFAGGNAVFTFPNTPIKCADGPQKIMWRAEHHFEQRGIRDQCNIVYASATKGIFGDPRYARALDKLAAERDIQTHYRHNLVAVRPASKEAVFESLDGADERVLTYDFLHVTPPMSAPDFVKRSPLANADGWVDVDMHTTQHVTYPNVFSLGDASSLPCSKTGAAIRKQAPVTVENIRALTAGQGLTGRYHGYASCPIVTGHGRPSVAESGDGGGRRESFPSDQARERHSMWAQNAHGLPHMYWHGMLRGRM